MKKEKIRMMLCETDRVAFDHISGGTILGASNHIRMIGDMFIHIAMDNARAKEDRKLAVLEISQYFKKTRGKSSYAFVNAMSLMTSFLHQELSDVSLLAQRVQAYFKQNDDNCNQILSFAQAEAATFHTIMIYDYSSTVEKFICSLPSKKVIYIPESRTIDGGKPFIKPIHQAGHDIRYIPDACMMSVLAECDAVFIGAETIYPDGTSFNTAGSDILAVLCQSANVPYYVLTPLIKTDMRATYGIYKDIIFTDLKTKLTKDWSKDLANYVDCMSIELVAIKPKYITAIITEVGILPPSALYPVALAYQQKIMEGDTL